MKCALCKINDANKKNTHYLTDSIIRSCLNEEGLNVREKGFYFDMSSNNGPFVQFNYQRNVSLEKLENSLGRESTDLEIEKAKQIPFSVDFVFCSQCESLFCEIEEDFTTNILPHFRNKNLSNIENLAFKEVKTIRLFFYIQIWRTAICEKLFKISYETNEKLRSLIYGYRLAQEEDIKEYPLSITYLETSTIEEFTENCVMIMNHSNPNFIIMNDFVIQFYELADNITYFDFYGLNEITDYKSFVNKDEDSFIIKIIHNEDRKNIFSRYIKEEQVKRTLEFLNNLIIDIWSKSFGVYPNSEIIAEFINIIVGNDEFNILQYSEENIKKHTFEFITQKIRENGIQ